MTLENVLLRVGLPLKQSSFMMFTIVFIVLSRIAVILATPHAINHPDPVIYQTTGRATLMGVNPYNFLDHPDVMHQLMVDAASRNAYVGGSQGIWDYYVSSNLPVSTMLYAVFEKISHGSLLAWRLLFVLGDVGIFLGLVSLARGIHGKVTKAPDQVAIFVLSALYPSLIQNGTIIPEDKQFETVLMLFSVALTHLLQ